MLHKLFAIRDSKGEMYTPPFCKATFGLAEREFSELANNPQSQIGKHPEDFDLYQLGDYEDTTGKLQLLDSPQHLVKAVNLLRPQQ